MSPRYESHPVETPCSWWDQAPLVKVRLVGISLLNHRTHINEGGVDVVRVRNPLNRSQVNPGMIIWRKIKTLH